jgi:hypothetical protein
MSGPLKAQAIELSPEQRMASAWIDQNIHDRLPNIRELATQWGATVTAITALLGAGTIISSDDVVAPTVSSTFGAVSYGLLVLIALICASASILQASLASQRKETTIPASLESRVELLHRTIERAEKALRSSRIFAAVAGTLIVLALIARWIILRA